MKEINEVNEAINEGNEAFNEGNEGNEESIQMGVSKKKEKKPRSIKQQEALKKAQAARKLKLEQKKLEKKEKETIATIPEKIPDDSEGEAGVEEYEQKYIIEKKKKPKSLKKKLTKKIIYESH